jgi:hypothetical protein
MSTRPRFPRFSARAPLVTVFLVGPKLTWRGRKAGRFGNDGAGSTPPESEEGCTTHTLLEFLTRQESSPPTVYFSSHQSGLRQNPGGNFSIQLPSNLPSLVEVSLRSLVVLMFFTSIL